MLKKLIYFKWYVEVIKVIKIFEHNLKFEAMTTIENQKGSREILRFLNDLKKF